MQKNSHYIKLCLVFIAIIGIPAIQTLTRVFHEKKLNGSVYDQPLPDFGWDKWYHFQYQPGLNKHIEQNFGFRTFFVRLYNQLDYSLFRQPHADGVVVGKDGYLFEEWILAARAGLDYIGTDSVQYKVRQLKNIRNYFKNCGKELIVLIAPGKADFYPEYIPERWKRAPAVTNYGAMSEAIHQAGVPLLDFNKLFMEMKDTAGCGLFPTTGMHWSHFGGSVATDTLSGFIASILKRPMPEFHVGPAFPADSISAPDEDLEKIMNLFLPLKKQPLCYPGIYCQSPDGFNLPSAIVIGDSFFWNMYCLPLNNRLFSDVQYWYYNSTIYHDDVTERYKAGELKFPDAFANTDLIILMVNPSNIQSIGWGFLHKANREMYGPLWQIEYDKMVKEYIRAIHNTPEWEKQIVEDARVKGEPADSLILKNARFMVEQYLLKNEMF